jgi:hypothetical protein
MYSLSDEAKTMPRMIITTVLLATCGLSSADDKKAPDEKKAAEMWDGTYGLIMASRDGKRDPILDKVNTVVIKDGMLTFQRPKGKDEVLKFTLDPTKGHIDLGTFPGVYKTEELAGKQVIWISCRIDGGERPKSASATTTGEGLRTIGIARLEK